MTARTLLERIIRIRKAIDYRRTKIDTLTDQAEISSSRLTGMPHNPSPAASAIENAICRKVDLEREIEELEKERNTLIAQIDLIEDPDLSKLLMLRYVQEAQWDVIAAEMGYCSTHIYRIHQKAISELDKRLKDGSKNE